MNTLAFIPLQLLLLLLPLGGFLGPALTLQCAPGSKTSHQKYERVNITFAKKTFDQVNATIYVKPQRDMPMKVVLEVKASDGASKTNAEFSLDKDCFSGDTEWWELFLKVKLLYATTHNHEVTTHYKLQVRTNTCIKPCVRQAHMEGLESLHVLTFPVSSWGLECPEDCHDVPQWNRTAYKYKFLQCADYKAPSSPSTTDSAMSTTTPATTTTTHSTSTTTHSTSTTLAELITTPAPPIAAVVGGIAAVAGIIAAVLVLVAVMRKRRGEAATGGASVRPKNAESPREDSANNLYELDGRQEPVYANVGRQGALSSPHEPDGRQEPVYGNIGKQTAVSSQHETIGRQESVNSLYEPLENFRLAQ